MDDKLIMKITSIPVDNILGKVKNIVACISLHILKSTNDKNFGYEHNSHFIFLTHVLCSVFKNHGT